MTSSTNARSILAAVAAALLTAAFMLIPMPTAHAWSNGPCTTTNGVTVVVDFARLGGGTVVRCAHGSQPSGVTALRNAGFAVGFVQQNMAQGLFVCRIAGKPAPSDETCANTPPANASWSYWIADRGGSWRYSNAGAGNRKPPTGTVEGWRFTSGRPVAPSVAPPPAIPPKPAPKPTSQPTHAHTHKPNKKPTTKPNGTTGSTSSSAGSELNASSANADQPKSANRDEAKTASASASPTAVVDDPTRSAAVAGGEAANMAGQDDVSSNPTGTIVALAALVLLGVAGVFTWIRRSRGR